MNDIYIYMCIYIYTVDYAAPSGMPHECLPGKSRGRLSYTICNDCTGAKVEVLLKQRAFRISKIARFTKTGHSVTNYIHELCLMFNVWLNELCIVCLVIHVHIEPIKNKIHHASEPKENRWPFQPSSSTRGVETPLLKLGGSARSIVAGRAQLAVSPS